MADAFEPMPYHVQFVKNSQDIKPVNIFSETTEEKTKTQSSFHSKERLYKVPQTISFHINRENNRLCGTSTDGEIFYYEAIDCGQCFVTKIEGDKTLINDLLNTVFRGKDTLNGKIGRSKSVEYGKVDIKTM
ncbi:MAG: hypothetical protein IPJ54_10880, partial [Saprospiraceae bacterium]|nr:hypothetical protein [Saprospiraceae bacterium]